eukprot:768609-Hanusia_phi.AAC.5
MAKIVPNKILSCMSEHVRPTTQIPKHEDVEQNLFPPVQDIQDAGVYCQDLQGNSRSSNLVILYCCCLMLSQSRKPGFLPMIRSYSSFSISFRLDDRRSDQQHPPLNSLRPELVVLWERRPRINRWLHLRNLVSTDGFI